MGARKLPKGGVRDKLWRPRPVGARTVLCRRVQRLNDSFAWLMLVVGLVVILIGCDVFTNSIEWVGKKLDLNEGVLGSIFAAVGTALPETLIPVVAVIFAGTAGGEAHSDAHAVGIGAIIGAPFMLATVAMFVTGIAVFIFKRRGRRASIEMKVNSRILSRDIRFFLLAFIIAVAAGFIED